MSDLTTLELRVGSEIAVNGVAKLLVGVTSTSEHPKWALYNLAMFALTFLFIIAKTQ
jgi:hypothetical protein